MPKKITQKRFNEVVSLRVNTATRALDDVARMVENYPDFMSKETLEKIDTHVNKANRVMVEKSVAAMERDEIGTVEEFSIDGAPKIRRKRRTKKEMEEARAAETVVRGATPDPNADVEKEPTEEVAKDNSVNDVPEPDLEEDFTDLDDAADEVQEPDDDDVGDELDELDDILNEVEAA